MTCQLFTLTSWQLFLKSFKKLVRQTHKDERERERNKFPFFETMLRPHFNAKTCNGFKKVSKFRKIKVHQNSYFNYARAYHQRMIPQSKRIIPEIQSLALNYPHRNSLLFSRYGTQQWIQFLGKWISFAVTAVNRSQQSCFPVLFHSPSHFRRALKELLLVTKGNATVFGY